MKFYWTINSIPELQEYPPEQRKKIWRSAALQVIDFTMLLFLGAIVGATALTVLLILAVYRLSGLPALALIAVCASIMSTFVIEYHVYKTRLLLTPKYIDKAIEDNGL